LNDVSSLNNRSKRRAVPGPKSKAIFAEEAKVMAPGLQSIALFSQIVVDHAEGCTITDVDGNEYLDFIAGIAVGSVGHSHPHYVKRLKEQIEQSTFGSFTTETRARFLNLVASLLPEGLTHLQLFSGGAEAVEAAFRLAKSVTKKFEFIGFWGGFHGKSQGVIGMLGGAYRNHQGPFPPGMHHSPYANCYRCPFNLQHPSCGMACAEHLRNVIKNDTQGELAAIVIEPMQGTAGNVIPPKEFLPAIKEVAREFDALLIVDEMITGFGRTGEYWGAWHSGVHADVVTIGKQFGGGFPISGIISTDEIASAKPWSDPSGSSSSYGGNPLAAAAASASLRIIDDEALVENCQRVGEYFLKRIADWVERFSLVGDVRGAGLFIGIDLVSDKTTKEPLSKNSCRRIFDECLRRGLLTMTYTPRVRFQPAMTIDEGTIDGVVAILAEVFEQADREGWAK
jgi:4-aminobutyrate aminotransferase-like enzyme